jgi:hypothetical protein
VRNVKLPTPKKAETSSSKISVTSVTTVAYAIRRKTTMNPDFHENLFSVISWTKEIAKNLVNQMNFLIFSKVNILCNVNA